METLTTKTCPVCGMERPRSEYLYISRGRITRRFKCHNCYLDEMKQRSEVRYAQKHNGAQLKHRKMWTDEMINVLYDLFPNTRNRDIAEQLGISESAVREKARDFGLHKAKSYIHAIRSQQAETVNAKRREWKTSN